MLSICASGTNPRLADGRLPADSLVVCTVTGNGLKDPDTAMTFMTEPVVLPVAAEAVTEALGLTG